MTDPKQDVRQQFEAWYVENVFAYEANPLGSRDCGLQRKAWQAALQSPAVRELVEACKAWDRWNYEVQSAKANGESIYSFDELQAMRIDAQRKADTALRTLGAGHVE